MIEMVECSQCGEPKHHVIANFVPNRQCRNGLSRTCKVCSRANQAAWRKANPELDARQRERSKASSRVRTAERMRRFAEVAPYRYRAEFLRGGVLHRTKERGLSFDPSFLTIAALIEWLQRQPNCDCCGVPFAIGPTLVKGQRCNASPSLDRIVPELGYVRGNVALICWRCNNLKRDAGAAELRLVANWTAFATAETQTYAIKQLPMASGES